MEEDVCRRCSECQGRSHHWGWHACEQWPCGFYWCQHCPATGIECIECGGQGCEQCNGEGVQEVALENPCSCRGDHG